MEPIKWLLMENIFEHKRLSLNEQDVHVLLG